MIHISLDLETWGKRPGCDIRSIGAVVFDPHAPGGWSVSDHTLMNGDTFYIAADNPIVPADYPTDDNWRKYSLHRDPETVKWWSDQSDEAQAAFDNPVDLKEGLIWFADWLYGFDDIKLWANDPHFDVSILEAAYHAVGLPVPWHYRAPRSMRTVVDLSGLTRDEYVTHGTAHNALDDAIAQAGTVCRCYERLGLTDTA